MRTKSIYDPETTVSFHISRGGIFNNPGHITFEGVEGIGDVADQLADRLFNPDTDDDAAEWTDSVGNPVGLTNEEYKANGEGRINFDNDYNTWYTREIKDLSDAEVEAIAREGNESEEQKQVLFVLSQIGNLNVLPFVTSVKFYPSNVDIFLSDGNWMHVERDYFEDYDRYDVIEYFEGEVNAESIEELADAFERHQWID